MRLIRTLAVAVCLFALPVISQQLPSQAKPIAKRPVAASQKALALAALTDIDKWEVDANHWPLPKNQESETAAWKAIGKVSDLELRKSLTVLMMDLFVITEDNATLSMFPNDNKFREHLKADIADYKRDHLEMMNKLI
jgi:hypothetical protein